MLENNVALTEIAELSGGDMRMAVNSLQMTFGGREKSKKKMDVILPVSCRDRTMLLFSALGKFLYSKRTEIEEDCGQWSLPGHLRDKFRPFGLSFDPEDVISRCSLTPESFVQFLHENCWNMFPDTSLEGAAAAADDLSSADSLTADWTARMVGNDNYLGSIAGRSIAFNNAESHELKHQRFMMRRPKWKDVFFNISRRTVELRDAFGNFGMSPNDLSSEVIPYLKIMNAGNVLSDSQCKVVSKLGKWTSNSCGMMERGRLLNEKMDYVSSVSGGSPTRGKRLAGEVTEGRKHLYVELGEDPDYDIQQFSDTD